MAVSKSHSSWLIILAILSLLVLNHAEASESEPPISPSDDNNNNINIKNENKLSVGGLINGGKNLIHKMMWVDDRSLSCKWCENWCLFFIVYVIHLAQCSVKAESWFHIVKSNQSICLVKFRSFFPYTLEIVGPWQKHMVLTTLWIISRKSRSWEC